MLEYLLILVLAVVLDIAFGELPNRVHPVAWLGKVISWQLKLRPKGKALESAYGALVVLFTVFFISMPVYFLLDYLRDVHVVLFVLVGAIILKGTFSLRELHRAALRVKSPLEEGDLSKARSQLGMIVSRNTGDLSEDAVVAATVESVSENTADSFVSPLFYFLLLGIPGAIAYRVCNTYDAMIGYHDEYEYLGKFAARLDDVLNFIPARLCGVVIIIAAWFSRKRAGQAWRVMWRDHGKTESPNAGWPMAAVAGALGVEVEKEGHYRLGDSLTTLSSGTIKQAIQIMWVSAAVWATICLTIKGISSIIIP